jgi:predicted GIY-YIG superfamily endonuclease
VTLQKYLTLSITQQEDLAKIINSTVKKHLKEHSSALAIRKTQRETGASLMLVRHCMRQDEAIVREGKSRKLAAAKGWSWNLL